MDHKQVIVMRKDLNMRKGKMVAQGAHASLKALLDLCFHAGGVNIEGQPENYGVLVLPLDERIAPWLSGRFKKICAYVQSEQELMELYEKAKAAGMLVSLIEDSGLTEFNGVVTKTCIAVGPDASDKVDAVTGHLPLL